MNAFVVTPFAGGNPPNVDHLLGLAPEPAGPTASIENAKPEQLPLPLPHEDQEPDHHEDMAHDINPVPAHDEDCEPASGFQLEQGAMFSLMPEWRFAEYMGFTLQTIASWRKSGKGPRYTMVGKQIFYQEKEIYEWLDQHTKESGS